MTKGQFITMYEAFCTLLYYFYPECSEKGKQSIDYIKFEFHPVDTIEGPDEYSPGFKIRS